MAAALGALMVSDGIQAQFVDAREYRLTLALVAGLYAALAVRRVAPLVCVGVQLALLVPLSVVGIVVLDAYVPVAVGVYSVTTHRRGQWHVAAAVAGMALGATNGLGTSGYSTLAVGLGWYAVLLVAAGWAFGLAARQRLRAQEALEDRARRLEVERDQQAELGAAAERERIAREMHDVIAHSLSVVVAQADGARYAVDRDPAAARTALAAIGDVARRALRDTRSMLGLLREPHASGEVLAPQVGLEGIPALLDTARAGGLAIEFEEQGRRPSVPGPVSLALYRAVQESVTNVLRHAGAGTEARLALTWRPREVTWEAVNRPGAGETQVGGAGLGLTGMAERAASLGGTVVHGRTDDGGFRVQMTLPLSREDA